MENPDSGGKSEGEKKKPMTDEERLALAEKLDRELDELIDSFPKREYSDEWSAERWQEEIETHPFFMSKPPEPGAELHPLYEGLQKLKYDPEENSPDELALAYKEDGNFNFRHKKYRIAVYAYTEGIKVKCGVPEIAATLYNNRAAAHFFLGNYRSCLNDCEMAIKLKADYNKAIERAANCCYHLKHYDKAIQYCDIILAKQKDHKEMIELRKKCSVADKIRERDERKKRKEQSKIKVEERVLLDEIKKRGIRLQEGLLSLEHLEPHFPQLAQHKVHLDEEGNLVWPVVFLYPEYKIMDYIEGFNELNTFQQQIEHVFQTTPEWDEEKKYIPENVSVFFEDSRGMLFSVDKDQTLGDILRSQDYVVQGGTPSFILLVRESAAGKGFLRPYNLE